MASSVVCDRHESILTAYYFINVTTGRIGVSRICKICIVSDEKSVRASVLQYMNSIKTDVMHELSEWPLAGQRAIFKNDEDPPTVLSVKQATEDVTELYYNSFNRMIELSTYLSSTLRTKVVVNIHQSTAEACYWVFYSHGEQFREIYSAEYEVFENHGSKLPFEGDEPGHNSADEGEDPFYAFSSDDMDEYNRQVGVMIDVYHQYEAGWNNYKIDRVYEVSSKTPHGMSSSSNTSTEKLWWQFWRR